MPFEPLRFLHTAGIHLDHPIPVAVPVPPEIATVVGSATRTAFGRLIDAALEHRVDFVLLAGNTFVAADQSLVARLDLLDGLRRLAADEIRVFVLPGTLDPVEEWRQIPDLPPNVTILEHDPESPATDGRGGKQRRSKTGFGKSVGHVKSVGVVRRDDTVVARIIPSVRIPERKKTPASQRALRSETQRPVAFTVGVCASGEMDDARDLAIWSNGQDGQQQSVLEAAAVNEATDNQAADFPVDYLAFGGGRLRRTILQRHGVAHDPGPLQGGKPDQSGPRGCTLVNVEADGTVRCDFIPTDVVRWERFSVEVGAAMSREEMMSQCRSLLSEIRWEAGEQASIVEWTMRGESALFDLFADESHCRQFQRELSEGMSAPIPGIVAHHLRLQPNSNLDPTETEPLVAEFGEALAHCRRDSNGMTTKCLDALRATDPQWCSRMEALLQELDLNSAGAHAQRIGKEIFQTAAAAEGMPR